MSFTLIRRSGNGPLICSTARITGTMIFPPITGCSLCRFGSLCRCWWGIFFWFGALRLSETAVERHVTRLHNQHHFRDFNKWFHVSPGGEIIDRAMGTDIDTEALKQQQRIAFIRTLGMKPDDPRLLAARAKFAGRYGLSEAEVARAARG